LTGLPDYFAISGRSDNKRNIDNQQYLGECRVCCWFATDVHSSLLAVFNCTSGRSPILLTAWLCAPPRPAAPARGRRASSLISNLCLKFHSLSASLAPSNPFSRFWTLCVTTRRSAQVAEADEIVAAREKWLALPNPPVEE
jgi:hypothetical protein